jgi:23S rRNA (uracil1939-C5)-methyltransferase
MKPAASPSEPGRPRVQPRARRFIPKQERPTLHPRRGGLGTLHAGERLNVLFSGVNPEGWGVAHLGPVWLAVPFGVPGEQAVVEITKGGRRAEGKLVALVKKSADVVLPRCRHFGRCGGCQWQHMSPDLQRRWKTRLVKDFFKEHAAVRRDLVLETIGGEAWAYRNSIHAVFGDRDGIAVVGYHAAASSHVLDIAECPVQHPGNEAVLRAARHAVRTLGLPVYDRATGAGLVRGVAGLASFATGEVLLTVSTTGPLPDRTDLVHALIDRVPGLVGILHTVQPRRTPNLLGPRLRLLWGRDSIEEEIAGFRLRLRPTTELPAHPRAVAHLVDAFVRAAAPQAGETAVDLTADTPVTTLALAAKGDAATGITQGRRETADAREAAARNGIINAAFAAGEPVRVLTRLAERRRPGAVAATAHGQGLDPALIDAVASARVARVAYVGRSLATCARDLDRWRRAGYRPVFIQPVDLLPQTSHVHLVVALRRVAA